MIQRTETQATEAENIALATSDIDIFGLAVLPALALPHEFGHDTNCALLATSWS